MEKNNDPEEIVKQLDKEAKRHNSIKRILNISLVTLILTTIGSYSYLYLTNHQSSPSNTPSSEKNTPSPTTTPTTNKNTLTVGEALGPRPIITGAMGWTAGGVSGKHSIFFQKVKSLEIDNIRIMSVLAKYPDWTSLNSAINNLTNNKQNIILCLGDLGAPPISNKEIDSNAKELKAMIDNLVTTYGIDKVNSMPIELDNEYGVGNLTYLIKQYSSTIRERETKYPGLKIKILAPAMQRMNYSTLDMALKYIKGNNISIDGISVHYYKYGTPKPPADFSFSMWLSSVEEVTKKYGFDNLPLYITEYGFNGSGADIRLKDSYNAAWLASRLSDKTYYNLQNTTIYISGVYGQPFTNNDNRGWLGLFDGFSGSNAPYPIERELELESRFGNSTLYSVKGINNKDVDGVTDNKGQWMFWNLGTQAMTVNIPTNTNKSIGYIDASNGNAKTLMEKLNITKNFSAQATTLLDRSNPFNDPDTGTPRASVKPDNGTLQATIQPNGVIFITN